MAMIGSVEKNSPAATKPRSILKALSKIGSTVASNVVWVSTSTQKSNSLKVKEAAKPVTPSKCAAARVSDPFEDTCAPKKAKVADLAVDNNTEEETDVE